jgi:hypothetical protein
VPVTGQGQFWPLTAQCRYLMTTAIPGRARTVVGADLNLTETGEASVRACTPAGWSGRATTASSTS